MIRRYTITPGAAARAFGPASVAIHVDFTVTVEQLITIEGYVTLLPEAQPASGPRRRRDGPGHVRYTSWGSVDHWIDPESLAILTRLPEPIRGELLRDLAETTGAVADAFASGSAAGSAPGSTP